MTHVECQYNELRQLLIWIANVSRGLPMADMEWQMPHADCHCITWIANDSRRHCSQLIPDGSSLIADG
eukprot:2355420-Karenia_brevis.AAC.1